VFGVCVRALRPRIPTSKGPVQNVDDAHPIPPLFLRVPCPRGAILCVRV
jgi:hypothetical protein